MPDTFNNKSLVNTFNHISTWAGKLTGVYVDTGAKKEPIYNTANSCLHLVETLMKHEETEFMVAPVLEHYFNMMRPAIVLPLDKILAGTCDELDECRQFVKTLAEHPVRTLWAERAENFRKIAESAGYTFDKTDYRDLPTIAPIVADAVTTFEYYHARQILQLRDGAPSMQQPILLGEIAVFASIAEAIQTLERIPAPAFIGFFGIEQTYGMYDDAFEVYQYGHGTRKRNIMYNGRMTEEEYQNTVDTYSRRIYCIVRDGGNIWIFRPRIEEDQYHQLTSSNTFINFYGRRGTWAPIQVFFDGTAPAKEGSTALVPYRKKLWSLKDILDEEQKVWLPIFFTTVKAKFFGEVPVEADPAISIQETQITMQLPDSNQPTNLPAIIRNNLMVPAAEDLFSREDNPAEYINSDKAARIRHHGALTMMRWLGITSADIADAPIAFTGAVSTKEAQKEIDRRTILAYYKVIGKKLDANWQLPTYEAQTWYHEYIYHHLDQILSDVKSGALKSCAKIIIDKQPVLNEDGTPKMYKPYSWSNAMEPVISKTCIDDGKYIKRYGNMDIHEYRDWFPSTLIDKRPPVTVKLNPQSPEEVAQICHCTVDDLPEAIRYMDYMKAFGDRHGYGNYRITLNFSKTEAKKHNLLSK